MRRVHLLTLFTVIILIAGLGLVVHTSVAGFSLGSPTLTPIPLTAVPAMLPPGLSATSSPVGVFPTVLPPGPLATPMVCAQNLPGLTLGIAVKQESQPSIQRVFIDGKGFTPDEKLLIVVEGYGRTHRVRQEDFPIPASADGTLIWSVLFERDEPLTNWKLFVVHKRGVACASFTTQ